MSSTASASSEFLVDRERSPGGEGERVADRSADAPARAAADSPSAINVVRAASR